MKSTYHIYITYHITYLHLVEFYGKCSGYIYIPVPWIPLAIESCLFAKYYQHFSGERWMVITLPETNIAHENPHVSL